MWLETWVSPGQCCWPLIVSAVCITRNLFLETHACFRSPAPSSSSLPDSPCGGNPFGRRRPLPGRIESARKKRYNSSSRETNSARHAYARYLHQGCRHAVRLESPHAFAFRVADRFRLGQGKGDTGHAAIARSRSRHPFRLPRAQGTSKNVQPREERYSRD